MATEKKNDPTLTVEQRLKTLYELQTILTEIDRIRTIRGELPLEVSDLEDQIEGLKTRIENYTAEIESLRLKIAAEKEKVLNARKEIDKYQEQIKEVRNNREFENFSKEIEYQGLEIELSEKHQAEYSRVIDARQNEIVATREQLSDREHILADKKLELNEIVSETKQEEESLRAKAQELEAQFQNSDADRRLLTAFKRIRKNARNGLGIVTIQRNACGGCFNRIPPQKQMEIKMHKKVIVCEYCGRIMIDPDLAGVDETVVAESN